LALISFNSAIKFSMELDLFKTFKKFKPFKSFVGLYSVISRSFDTLRIDSTEKSFGKISHFVRDDSMLCSAQ
jgi:hypothetical protein